MFFRMSMLLIPPKEKSWSLVIARRTARLNMSSFKRPMSAVSTKLRRKAPVHVSYGVKNLIGVKSVRMSPAPFPKKPLKASRRLALPPKKFSRNLMLLMRPTEFSDLLEAPAPVPGKFLVMIYNVVEWHLPKKELRRSRRPLFPFKMLFKRSTLLMRSLLLEPAYPTPAPPPALFLEEDWQSTTM